MHDDSDSDEDHNSLTVIEKETRLNNLKRIADESDIMILQDALVRTNWNVMNADKHLKERLALKKRKIASQNLPVIQNSLSNNDAIDQYHKNKVSNSRHNKKQRRRSIEDNSGSDDETPSENVFDSDEDSDVDVSLGLIKQRKKVLDFLNDSTEYELLTVKSCTVKNVSIILSSRPFSDWQHLVSTLQSKKFVTTDLLNNCQELIARRENLSTIMKKCNKIVQRLEKAVKSDAGITEQPKILNPHMKLAEYQIVGLNWMAVIHKEETNGILADEMGLGKTIQVIAFLAYLKENGYQKNSHLIIVPSSTLDNWENEFKKWCPSLVVGKYYGSSEERRALRIEWAKQKFSGLDVILTTYRTVTGSPEEKKLFRVTPIHYVVFDEAHMLKNMTTQRYAYLVRIRAERRLLLTGTPLQNSLLELMSLLCFVMPSIFAKKSDDIKAFFQKSNVSIDDLVQETFKC